MHYGSGTVDILLVGSQWTLLYGCCCICSRGVRECLSSFRLPFPFPFPYHAYSHSHGIPINYSHFLPLHIVPYVLNAKRPQTNMATVPQTANSVNIGSRLQMPPYSIGCSQLDS